MAINKLPKLYSTDFRLPNKKPIGDVEVDYSDELASSARDILLFNEDGNPLRNIGAGGDWNEIGADFEPAIVNGNKTYKRSDTDQLGGSYIESEAIAPTSVTGIPFYIYCIYTVLVNPANNKGVLSIGNAFQDGTPVILLASQSSSSLRYYVDGSYRFTDIPAQVGERHVLVHRYSDSIHDLYDSAKGVWEQYAGGIADGKSADTFRLGTGFAGQLPCDFDVAAYGNGDIPSLAYFKDLVKNPYKFLKPKSEPVYFTADAGGGGTITVPATLGTIAYASQNTTVSIAGSIDVTATLGTISYVSNNTTVDVSGSVDAIATLGTISYASNNTTVGVTGSVDVLTTLGTITYTSNNTTVSVSGAVDVTATLGTINYASNDVVVGVTGSVDVVATLGTINYTSNNPVVSIGGVVVVQATLGTISYASNDTVISLQGVVSVPATLGTISYASNDTVVSLAGLIDVNATLGTISYTSNNTTVTVAAGQAFGVVGVGFADDLYGSTFKPDSITVNFRG